MCVCMCVCVYVCESGWGGETMCYVGDGIVVDVCVCM